MTLFSVDWMVPALMVNSLAPIWPAVCCNVSATVKVTFFAPESTPLLFSRYWAVSDTFSLLCKRPKRLTNSELFNWAELADITPRVLSSLPESIVKLPRAKIPWYLPWVCWLFNVFPSVLIVIFCSLCSKPAWFCNSPEFNPSLPLAVIWPWVLFNSCCWVSIEIWPPTLLITPNRLFNPWLWTVKSLIVFKRLCWWLNNAETWISALPAEIKLPFSLLKRPAFNISWFAPSCPACWVKWLATVIFACVLAEMIPSSFCTDWAVRCKPSFDLIKPWVLLTSVAFRFNISRLAI